MFNHYKTMVVDYEAMQACLDQHAEQGWKLKSVTPDSWRRVLNVKAPSTPGEPLDAHDSGAPEEELVASYYLLVFVRDDEPVHERGRATAAEAVPESGFTFPEF